MKTSNFKLKIILSIVLFIGFFIFAPSVFAANKYWVGGTGSWSDDDNHWATSSGGTPADGNLPTSSDNVYFDANSNATDYTVTVTPPAPVAAINLANPASGAVTLNGSGAGAWSVYGSITLAAGTHFDSLSAALILYLYTGGNITTNGVDFNFRTIILSGTWTLQDAFTSTNASGLTVNGGTLDTNNQTVTLTGGLAGATSGIKTFTFGTSTITSSKTVDFSTANTTVSAASSTFILLTTANFSGGGNTFNAVQLNGTAHTVSQENIFATLTRTGTAVKTDSLTFADNQTITGTLIINGNSSVNRIIVQSSVKGTQRTLTAATVSVTNSDFQDIVGAGAGDWDLSAITGLSGDAGGNSGITFTTAATQYWHVDTGSWSDGTKWFLATDGGGGAGRVPLPQDDVVFDASSFDSNSKTITIDMPRLGKNIDWSGVDNSSISCLGINTSFFGSYAMPATAAHSGNFTLTAEGRGSYTFTNNGVNSNYYLALNAPGGTLTLQDAFTTSYIRSITVYAGTFDANNQDITVGVVSSNNSNVRTIIMGSGTWTITGSGTIWDIATVTNLTLTPNSSTIKLTNDSVTNKTFAGGGLTYNNFWNATAGTGEVRFTGSNTFNDFKIDAGRTVRFTAATTTTVTTFTAIGTSGSHITIGSITSAVHRLAKAGGGLISGDYLDITYSDAAPANTWYATNSTGDANTTGWTFTAVPGSTYQTLAGKGVDSYQVMMDDSYNIYGFINVTSTASAAIDNTKWRHVVMTYDGANQKLYVDGVLQSTVATSSAIRTNPDDLEIGENFAGKIDNVRVYDRALSQAEITAAYGSYSPGIVMSDLQKGLMGWWKMDGGAKDSSPNSNHCTVTNAVLNIDRKGQNNRAYYFDGSGDYLSCGTSSTIRPDAFTVAAWVKDDNVTATAPIIGFSPEVGAGDGITVTYGRTAVKAGIVLGGNNARYFNASPVNIYDGNWHHVVFTMPGGAQTDIESSTMWADGQQQTVLSTVSTDPQAAKTQVRIGNSRNYNLTGLMDDVRIYNRVLSQAEITVLYEEYNPGIVVSDLQKGLVGQWEFDGNAKDSTPNSHHGTVTDATLIADRKGQANKAYSFNGTSDHIVTGNVGSGIKTVSFWMQADDTTIRKIIDIDGTDQIELDGSSDITATSFPGTTIIYVDGVVASGIPDGNWHFVAITDTTGVNAAAMDIGAVSTSYFDGKLDEVRVYNRALTAAEVTALYESY